MADKDGCSIPIVFGFQHWFDARFGDLCKAHDAAWKTRIYWRKVAADYLFCHKVAMRGYPCFAWVALQCFRIGVVYWLWKKGLESWKRYLVRY